MGLGDALSLIVTVPDFAPCDCGEKVTLMVQLLPAATLFPQVELMANCPATFIAEIVSGVLPVFVNVTFCAGLDP